MKFDEWWDKNHAPHCQGFDSELVEIIKRFSKVAFKAGQKTRQPTETERAKK